MRDRNATAIRRPRRDRNAMDLTAMRPRWSPRPDRNARAAAMTAMRMTAV